MPRTRLWIVLAFAGFAVPALGAPASWLRPSADYMADTVIQADGGELAGRVWASGSKERRELTVKGRRHVVILRKDRGVSWVLMPEQRLYLETALSESDPGGGRYEGGDLQRDAIGQETVNGAPATKYRVHGTTADGEAFEATMWMTGQEIPVRVVTGQGKERIHMELSNLSVGVLDPRRFELPSGYKRFELPAPAKMDVRTLRDRYSR